MDPYVVFLVVGLVVIKILRTISDLSRDESQANLDDRVKGTGRDEKFTWEEVRKHNTLKDLWLVIEGKVYDVTKYVPNHPGGNIIAKNGGGDSTEGFNGPQHPGRVKENIKQYYIGTVVDEGKEQ